LVNGTSIARLNADTVTYWHVELDRHDVLLAEGLPTESFLDAGNRDAFDGGTVDLLAHFPAAYHESRTCAPLALLGPAVAAARSMLMWK
jgi:serralysin